MDTSSRMIRAGIIGIHFGKIILACAVFLGTFLFGRQVDAADDAALKRINFDQKIGAVIPLDLAFDDESGSRVKLGKYFGKKPVILVLGYNRCPMLCNYVLNGMVGSLDDISWEIGNQFDIVDVSIDPKEKAALAAAKKKTYVRRYGRNDSSSGWHFLTGDAPEIQRLADTTGFRFLYDEQAKEFAHPSGLIVVTTDGHVSRYISGVMFSTEELNTALHAAARNELSSPVRQFFLMCFHYSPVSGKYGDWVMLGVRITGLAVLSALVTMFVRNIQNSRRTKPASATL